MQIPVRLRLGSIQMSGEQLLDLHSGCHVAIDVPDVPQVSLEVGGEVFATARLVTDESGLYLQIEQLLREEEYFEESAADGNRITGQPILTANE